MLKIRTMSLPLLPSLRRVPAQFLTKNIPEALPTTHDLATDSLWKSLGEVDEHTGHRQGSQTRSFHCLSPCAVIGRASKLCVPNSNVLVLLHHRQVLCRMT